MAITAREPKPSGAKQSWYLYRGPDAQRLLINRYAAALHIEGAGIRSPIVKSALERARTKPRVFNAHLP
jgi:hypothetical protein